jgi:hypothetical protein
MNAVDTNGFDSALDDTEPAKQVKAQELIGGLVQPPVQTVMLWQLAGELLSWLRKWESANRITADDLERHFRDAPPDRRPFAVEHEYVIRRQRCDASRLAGTV